MQYCWNTCSRGIVAGSVNFEDGDNYINVFLRNNNFPGSCIEQRLQVLVNLCPAVLELQDDNNPLFDAAENSLMMFHFCFDCGDTQINEEYWDSAIVSYYYFQLQPRKGIEQFAGWKRRVYREGGSERKKKRKKKREKQKERENLQNVLILLPSLALLTGGLIKRKKIRNDRTQFIML